MARLSVNINKIATLRNARGGNLPNLLNVARDIEFFGAQGITVHPRPDQRHIRYSDVRQLRKKIKTELNVEGNPIAKFMDLVLETSPVQVTLVPDAHDAITSNAGWNTKKHWKFLLEIISELKSNNIRTSIFIDPEPSYVEFAAKTGTNRIELYTEQYAKEYMKNPTKSIKKYRETSHIALQCGLEINAGHDLNLDNIAFFTKEIKCLKEVSIGHALICESLYYGLENTIQMYLHKLQQ